MNRWMSPFSLQRGIMRPTQTCDVIPHNSSLRERATGESLADCNRPFSFSQTPTGSCGRVFGGASSRYFCKGTLPSGETKLAPRFDVDAESAAVFSTGHACRGAKWLAIFFFCSSLKRGVDRPLEALKKQFANHIEHGAPLRCRIPACPRWWRAARGLAPSVWTLVPNTGVLHRVDARFCELSLQRCSCVK